MRRILGPLLARVAWLVTLMLGLAVQVSAIGAAPSWRDPVNPPGWLGGLLAVLSILLLLLASAYIRRNRL